MLRSRVLLLSLACLIGLAGAGLGRAAIGGAQTVDPTGYPVTINSGTCPAPDMTAAYEVGTTLPWGLAENADSTVTEGDVLTVNQVINQPLDNLILVGQPFSVVVASPDDAGTAVACGDIVNEVVDGRIAIKLAPISESGVAGVAVFDRDEQGFLGLGGEEVHVTVYVITGLVGAAAPATTEATAAATEAAAETAAPTAPAATTAEGTAAGPTVTIDAEDIYFKPNLITLPADTPVTVVFTNKGQAVHNFSLNDHNNSGLENLNIDVTVNPGETKTFTINAPAGDYYFYCDQPGHEQAGMRGYLNLADGAEISTSEATVTPRAG